MPITKITCADDLAALAKEAIEQFARERQFKDLIGAIMMANHVADWHFQVGLKKDVEKTEKSAMKLAYPKWDTIRSLANGAKHCAKVQTKHNEIQWEHHDFWESPGHTDVDGFDWFVEHEDEQRSVAVLIATFLDEFADSSARPK
ncbi:hypothetical protein [Undibacterium sp. Tian12W]|uniref:hypothetical protein n=1 Tax=Undibacterium sp. Tian12W TaxID=3413054 RepID=UPI003BF31483